MASIRAFIEQTQAFFDLRNEAQTLNRIVEGRVFPKRLKCLNSPIFAGELG